MPLPEKALAYRAAGIRQQPGVKGPVLPTTTARKTLEYAASKINGGKEAFIEYARMASNDVPEICAFLEIWDQQTKYVRQKWTLDQFAHCANVPWPKLIGAVAAAAASYNADVSDLVAMTSMPEVIQASIDSAKDSGETSVRDRELLMKHGGFLPVPKGSVINIANSAQANAASSASAGDGAGVPDFSDTILSSADVVRDAWTPDDQEAE